MITRIEKEVYQVYKRFTVYKFYKVTVDSDGVIRKQFLYNSTYSLDEV